MPMLTTDLLRRAYTNGIFPMAETAESTELMWFDPPRRGVLPMDDFHVPRRLRRTVRQGDYTVRVDSAFREVMIACGESTEKRPNTWINTEILDAYCGLYAEGNAHSVECWRDGTLLGGLYGVSIGGVFCGESMFSRATDASKVALVHLVARLRLGGYLVLDTQFVTDHLAQFGAREISRTAYRRRLAVAIPTEADFYRAGPAGVADAPEFVADFLQSITQTS